MTQPSPAEAFEPTPTSDPSTEASPSSSTDSSAPSAPEPRRILPLLLFLATAITVLHAGALWKGDENDTWSPRGLARGWSFALPLLTILLFHEFGHYFAARIHRVPASLPHFLPVPFSAFGTFGAVIGMPKRIASPRALLDIGAAGPLAGMLVALPILGFGLHLSEVHPNSPHSMQEGQSLLYLLMKRIFVGVIPSGSDVYLHPVALAGWVGLLVTMMNLIPFGSLDGGHIAYALVGKPWDRIGLWFRATLIPLALGTFALRLWQAKQAGFPEDWLSLTISSSTFWLIWFVMLLLIGRFTGKAHPPTDEGETLDPVRRAVAIFCLALFVLIFMPAPMTLT